MDDWKLLEENLRGKGYTVETFPDRCAAAEWIENQIGGRTVGIGGSVTVRELGLCEKLSKHNTVYWHEEPPENMTAMETRQAASRADIYIASVNGISLQGEIVNMDYTGNRVSAISFGPREVYLIIGRNKLAPDLPAALDRVKNVASPLNAKRLNRKTPCAVRGDRCYHCKSPEKICRNLSILLERPAGAEYHIILIDEDLGY